MLERLLNKLKSAKGKNSVQQHEMGVLKKSQNCKFSQKYVNDPSGKKSNCFLNLLKSAKSDSIGNSYLMSRAKDHTILVIEQNNIVFATTTNRDIIVC